METKGTLLVIVTIAILLIRAWDSNRHRNIDRLARRYRRDGVRRVMRAQYEQERNDA